jgi:amino acid transporter
MQVLLVTSALAAILAFHNAASRYLFALGREGAMPRALAVTHARHRSPWVAGVVMAIVSAVVCAGFALAGMDPYADLFILVNTPGTIGIVALQILAGVAVIGFFRRDARGEGPWATTIAPALAVVGLAAMMVFVLRNLSLLTARDQTVNVLLVATVAMVFLAGLGVAAWMRRARPQAYARLATTRVEGEDPAAS